MYFIIEGMPSSGKTTLAKRLAEIEKAEYIKSLLPNDAFGNVVRRLRDNKYNDTNVCLLHIIDLFRNELQISYLLDAGKSVVRDKCFLSSLAHYLSTTLDADQEMQDAVMMGYEEIARNMVQPDALILLDRPINITRYLSINKVDITAIDREIMGSEARFLRQQEYLRTKAKQYFGSRLLIFSGNETVDEEVQMILKG